MNQRPHRWPAFSLATASALVCAVLFYQYSYLHAQSVSPKLSTVLQDLAGAVSQTSGGGQAQVQGAPLSTSSLPKSVQDALHGQILRMDATGAVQVYVLMSVSNDTVQQLAAAGATVEITDAAHNRVQAHIPAARLNAVAALPFVNSIRTPTYARRHTGSVESEGDAIIQATTARQQFALDGTGVRVGVISDGIKGIFATGCTTCTSASGGPISTGDLPAAVGTRTSGVLTAATGGITATTFTTPKDLEGGLEAAGSCPGFAGAGAEGTALMEIVHDVAPGAQLSFANADTDLAFEQAVTFLGASNDVVMDDLGFYGEATDGTSPVSANTANTLNGSGPIRAYVTANGNSADEHYIGNYVDSGTDGTSISGITTSGHLHLFQSSTGTTDVLGLGATTGNVISLPINGEVVIFLTWNDSFGASGNNYDLYLVQQSTNKVVAKSATVQSGAQDPVEVIDYVNTAGSGFYKIVVQNVGNKAAAKQLNIFSFQPECATDGPRLLANGNHALHNYNTAAQSVPAQSDSGGSPVSVISAGAICSASAIASADFVGSAAPDESCNDTSHSTAEFFSSRGPTTDGRMKPDVAGIDGVSITGAGGFGTLFFGTSAATPHVAAVAALVLQAAPCLLSGGTAAINQVSARTALRNLVVTNATPISASPDNTFGSGLLNALQAVQKTVPTFQGSTTVTIPGNTPTGAAVTPSALGFTDPDGCALTTLNWTGGCGSSPGPAMGCPFGTSTVSVAASNNGLGFSSATTIKIAVTDFSMNAPTSTATVSAGQSATYQVAAAAQSGAFTGNVALTCTGLPAGASCSFSPSSLTPGTTSAASTLTITTTKGSSTGPLVRRRPRIDWRLVAIAALGGLIALGYVLARILSGVIRPRRRLASAFVALVAVAMLASQLACGSSSTTGTGSTGTTATPSVALSPSSLTFGNQNVGTSSSVQGVTLTNSGGAALSIFGVATSGDYTQLNSCGSSVAASANCVISVTFTPTAGGARTGTLTITDSASGSPHTVSLSGTGVAATTPPGTYPITVTGTSGTLTHSTTVTLIVQ